MDDLIRSVEEEHLREKPPVFEVGDTVNVGVTITERIEKSGKVEEKERVQVFGGVVIGRRGSGVNEAFTVRRIVAGEGVERTFPLHSPNVAYVEVVRQSRVRRAKLYYLRERAGKSARLKERVKARPKKKSKGDAKD